MSRARKTEARLLSASEQELVGRTRHPALRDIDARDLADLVKRLRELRDRARDVSHQQRREMRGKSAPSGARPAADNSGTKEKSALLAEALKRASKENERRRAASSRRELVSNAQRALEMKQGTEDPAAKRPASRTADEGMRPVPNEGIAPSGALDAEGHRPVLERSRMAR